MEANGSDYPTREYFYPGRFLHMHILTHKHTYKITTMIVCTLVYANTQAQKAREGRKTVVVSS